mgnify:CR=1 FL=1
MRARGFNKKHPNARGGGYGGYGRRQGVGIFREVMQPLQLWAKVSLAER